MHKYARIEGGQVVGLAHFPVPLEADQVKHVNGLPMLRPVVVEGLLDAHDDGIIDRNGPVFEIHADRVVERYSYTFRPDLRDVLCQRVDEAAERERQRYITAGAGQAMVYQAKEAEARVLQAAIAGGAEPVPGDYPHLAAEIGITGGTLAEVAEVILATGALWRQASADIEHIRLATKAAIRAAASDELSVAAADPEWSTSA